MTEVTTTIDAAAQAAPAVPAAPAAGAELATLAESLSLTPEETQAKLEAIYAEDYMSGIPEAQRFAVASGVLQSQEMSKFLDAGKPFDLHVVSVTPPETVTPKGKDPFTIANVFGIGYSKKPDGTDGPVGMVEVGIFIRDDQTPDQKNVWSKFKPGKTYNVSLAYSGTDPQPGQMPLYQKVNAASDTDPKEIPTPEGLDAAAFIRQHYKEITVADIESNVCRDWDDRAQWSCLDVAVISARRGISKKGNPYGFYEVVPAGTTPKDLQGNPNLKVSINANMGEIQYTIGSRLLLVGGCQPASDDGKYAASFRLKQQVPIVGIPYRVSTTDVAAAVPGAASAATADAADIDDF